MKLSWVTSCEAVFKVASGTGLSASAADRRAYLLSLEGTPWWTQRPQSKENFLQFGDDVKLYSKAPASTYSD